jgi:hypothetical protein
MSELEEMMEKLRKWKNLLIMNTSD